MLMIVMQCSNLARTIVPWQSAIVTPAQCKAARLLLGWNARNLAEAAMLAAGTVLRFEAAQRPTQARTIDRLRLTLERAGVEFSGDLANATPHASLRGVELEDGTFVRLRRVSPISNLANRTLDSD
jgi:transcriptional regulator with XRE-family HTH domain